MKEHFEKVREKMDACTMDDFNEAYYLGYIHALLISGLLSYDESEELILYRHRIGKEYRKKAV